MGGERCGGRFAGRRGNTIETIEQGRGWGMGVDQDGDQEPRRGWEKGTEDPSP